MPGWRERPAVQRMVSPFRSLVNCEEQDHASIVALDANGGIGNPGCGKDGARLRLAPLKEEVPTNKPMVVEGLVACAVLERRDEDTAGRQRLIKPPSMST